MNRYLSLAVAAFLGMAATTAAHAAHNIGGTVAGPDDSTTVRMRFQNFDDSTLSIRSIRLDGNTADAFPLTWGLVGPSNGNTGPFVAFEGEFSSVLTIEFISSFDPGEFFELTSMDVDGNPIPEDVLVSQLLGLDVLFTFSDNSTALYEFVEDPDPGRGLILALVDPTAEIPEPATLALLSAGLAGFGSARRRRR